MKVGIVLVIFFLFNVERVFAQNRTLIWYLGITTFDPDFPKPGLDFSSGNGDTFLMTRPSGFFVTEASICDTNGEMLFYTNGVSVQNRNNEPLLNSDNFNPGFSTDFYGDIGLGFMQGAIVIPKPSHPDNYYLFHVTGEEITKNGIYDIQPLHLSVSEVDMTLDGGLGGMPIDNKNIHIIEDTVSQGRITACKHANGNDWWVITHKYFSNVFYKVLVTSDSMLVSQQYIGDSYNSNDINGMAVFSPDGKQYAHLNHYDTLELYDFDRCDGELSNLKTLNLPDEGYVDLTLGCAFSPNSRFLYVNTYKRVFQFDTWADDIQASIVKVAQWDTSFLPFATYFFVPQLAADNKIYISPFAGIWILHRINSPDSAGLACDLQQHSVPLPYGWASNITLPNFPNYDLESIPGGDTCNVIFTTDYVISKKNSTYQIAPNPVSDWLNIIYQSKEDALFELFDLYGKRVSAISLFHCFKNRLLNVSELPPGVYVAAVSCKGERVWSEKVVVQR